MNLSYLTSTRVRRTGILILIVVAAGTIPLGPTWFASILTAVIAGTLAKAVLAALVAGESNTRAIKSVDETMRKHSAQLKTNEETLTSLTKQVESRLEGVISGLMSAQADISELTSKASEAQEAYQRLAEQVTSLVRTQQEVAETIDSWPRRLDRLETLTSQSTPHPAAHRRKSIGLGQGLDGPPETRLAAAIAGLRNSFAG